MRLLPYCRLLFPYFSGLLNSTPNGELEKVVYGYAVIQAQSDFKTPSWIDKHYATREELFRPLGFQDFVEPLSKPPWVRDESAMAARKFFNSLTKLLC
jgi:hypothetical protein